MQNLIEYKVVDVECYYDRVSDKSIPLNICIISNIYGIELLEYFKPNPDYKVGYPAKNLSHERLEIVGDKIENINKRIIHTVSDKNLIGYGIDFDVKQVPAIGSAKRLLCAKKRFAPYAGEWRDWCNDYKFKSLEFAMKFAGLSYNIEGFESFACRPHRAFIDCLATMRLWNWMNKNELKFSEQIKNFPLQDQKVIEIENAIY